MMNPLMANPMGMRPINKMAQPLLAKADGDGGAYPVDPGNPPGGNVNPDPPMNNMPNPINGGGTPPINGNPSQGGGDTGFTDWIKNQFGNFQGVLSNPSLIPSLAAAYQQYHQAHQYTDMAEHYADQLDPFGKQRGHYQDLMRQSYDDPTSVLQDPAYQKQLKFELGNLGIQNAGKGWDGSGNMMAALSDRQQNMDQAHLDDYRKGLAPLTGAQFGPQSAADMLRTGLLGRMGAENNAVGNLMVPFSNQNANNRSPGGGTGGQGGGAGGAAAAAQQAAQLLKNPGQLPPAMRNWPVQQLAQWLQYNNPLGNDAFGTWASGNTGADGGLNPGNIVLPGDQYQFGGAPNFGGDGGMGQGGFDFGGGGDGGLGGFPDEGIFDPGFFDFGGP